MLMGLLYATTSGSIGRRVNPLHDPAYSGSFEVVRILIEYDPTYINARDEVAGWMLLHWGSGGYYFKDGFVLRLLLEHGADINVQR